MHKPCRRLGQRDLRGRTLRRDTAARTPTNPNRRQLDQEKAGSGSPQHGRLCGRFVALALGLLVAACQSATAGPEGGAGRLVRLPDGRAINLVCSGRGSTTVLFESGFGADASAWSLVQPQLARSTRTCSYDRAGYGLSDPGPLPRDGAAVARDLDRALRAAGERGPFIVVGHSAGGLYAQLFAARRRREVIGLVLVDPSVPFQDRRPGQPPHQHPGLEATRRRPAQCLEAALARAGDELVRRGCVSARDPRALERALRPDVWRSQLSELDTLFDETSEEAARARPVIRNIPVVFLTASPSGQPAGPEDPSAMAWQALHRREAADFLQSDVRLVKSSHLMMIDRPEVVLAAVNSLLQPKSARDGP